MKNLKSQFATSNRKGKYAPYETSQYEYYLSAYEETYWECVKNKANDIYYKYTSGDLAGNDWNCGIEGYYNGYMDAEKMIDNMVKNYV